MVYGCSKGHISLVIELLLKEEFLVLLSWRPALRRRHVKPVTAMEEWAR